jgi:hypothetical protein
VCGTIQNNLEKCFCTFVCIIGLKLTFMRTLKANFEPTITLYTLRSHENFSLLCVFLTIKFTSDNLFYNTLYIISCTSGGVRINAVKESATKICHSRQKLIFDTFKRYAQNTS